MLSISSSQRYFIYSSLCDMRKGFDSLCGLVREEFKMSPLSGDVFIFISRTRNKIKLLQWQRDGFAIYYKRLEKGAFELPQNPNENAMLISSQKLMLIMEGIKLSSVTKLKRYEQNAARYERDTNIGRCIKSNNFPLKSSLSAVSLHRD